MSQQQHETRTISMDVDVWEKVEKNRKERDISRSLWMQRAVEARLKDLGIKV